MCVYGHTIERDCARARERERERERESQKLFAGSEVLAVLAAKQKSLLEGETRDQAVNKLSPLGFTVGLFRLYT